jgi:hypothetical protein
MTQLAPEASPLLPHWAFVVQFRAETRIERHRCEGRVEHVVSGQATHFASLEELLTFVARVLTTVRAQHEQP